MFGESATRLEVVSTARATSRLLVAVWCTQVKHQIHFLTVQLVAVVAFVIVRKTLQQTPDTSQQHAYKCQLGICVSKAWYNTGEFYHKSKLLKQLWYRKQQFFKLIPQTQTTPNIFPKRGWCPLHEANQAETFNRLYHKVKEYGLRWQYEKFYCTKWQSWGRSPVIVLAHFFTSFARLSTCRNK